MPETSSLFKRRTDRLRELALTAPDRVRVGRQPQRRTPKPQSLGHRNDVLPGTEQPRCASVPVVERHERDLRLAGQPVALHGVVTRKRVADS